MFDKSMCQSNISLLGQARWRISRFRQANFNVLGNVVQSQILRIQCVDKFFSPEIAIVLQCDRCADLVDRPALSLAFSKLDDAFHLTRAFGREHITSAHLRDRLSAIKRIGLASGLPDQVHSIALHLHFVSEG